MRLLSAPLVRLLLVTVACGPGRPGLPPLSGRAGVHARTGICSRGDTATDGRSVGCFILQFRRRCDSTIQLFLRRRL